MKSVDNMDKILPLLQFESEDDYYFLQVLKRKKDNLDPKVKIGGSNNSSRLIRGYNITSQDYLLSRYEEIRGMCELFGARACINLNKRSFRSASLQMMVQLAQSIQANNFRNSSMWNNVSGRHQPTNDKKWIIDIDNVGRNANEIVLFIERECLPEGLKYITTIPSRSGYHLITIPFDRKKFGGRFPDIDVHQNSPTNLYIP